MPPNSVIKINVLFHRTHLNAVHTAHISATHSKIFDGVPEDSQIADLKS